MTLQLAIRMSIVPYVSPPAGPHGLEHWDTVAQNGLTIARVLGANQKIVALFAYLHDTCREHDGHDPEHGERAAILAGKFRNLLFRLDDEDFETLEIALINHDKGLTTDDVTIGTCWDADRLDLPRVGITPDATYMSTPIGRIMAMAYESSRRQSRFE
jgi:uncharacterized protein